MIRNSKKHHTGRIISLLLALCITTAFLPIVAFATGDTASISVTFRQGSEDKGWIEIKNGTVWERYSGPEAQNAEAVRIRPITDYYVDWTGICLFENGPNILTDDIRNWLKPTLNHATIAWFSLYNKTRLNICLSGFCYQIFI